SAYVIVYHKHATSGRKVFAHEIVHLYGGKHNNDNSNPNWARGRRFWAGGTYRNTLMRNMGTQAVRVDQVSNPDVNFQGVPTGRNERNNAQRVNQFKNHIANFHDDPPLSIYVDVTLTHPQDCQREGIATATPRCGHPPYTYEWFTRTGHGP